MRSERSILVSSPFPWVSALRVVMSVQGKGDPLLLINGLSRPLQSWYPFTSQVRGRTVVSFDAPGVGGSPTPIRPLLISEVATIAVAVLDAAGLAEADVLGYSHGGAVAQELAHAAPERVSGLVLAATSCGVGATPGNGTDILRQLGHSLDRQPWPLSDPVGLLWQSLAVSNWSSIPYLGSIGAPTLVVCGSRDSVVPPTNSKVLARRIPNASLVMLPGRGHDLQRGDSAAELARVVQRFSPASRAADRLVL